MGAQSRKTFWRWQPSGVLMETKGMFSSSSMSVPGDEAFNVGELGVAGEGAGKRGLHVPLCLPRVLGLTSLLGA